MQALWMVLVTAFVGSLVWAGWSLPERVPVHYGLDGVVTRWGAPAELLVAVGLGGVFGAVVSGALGWAIGDGRLPLGMVNVPHKERWLATPEGEREVRRRLGVDMLGIGAAIAGALTVQVAATVVQVRDHLPTLPSWGSASTVVLLVVLLGWTVLAVTVRYRPPGT